MNTIKFLALAAILTMLGCNDGGYYYKVYIDGFSPEDTEIVLKSIKSWTDAIPALQLVPVIGACSGEHNEEICIHASDLTQVNQVAGSYEAGRRGITATNLFIDGGESWIDVPDLEYEDQNPESSWFFQSCVAHEMGHAMGLVHHAPGTLMAADLPQAAVTPTQDDIQQFTWIRSGSTTPANMNAPAIP